MAVSRAGRVSVGAWVLVVPLLVLVLAALHLSERPSGAASMGTAGGATSLPAPGSSPDVRVLAGEVVLPGGGLLGVRLSPLRVEPDGQDRLAARLASRSNGTLTPPDGGPWRLELRLEGETALALTGLRVGDAAGTALVPLSEVAEVPGGVADPLVTLFAVREEPGALGPGERTQLVLWGRAPREGESPRLELTGTSSVAVALEPAELPADELPRWIARSTWATGDEGTGADPRDAEIARLRREVQEERARRQDRELAWYRFNRSLGALRLDPGEVGFPVDEEALPAGLRGARAEEEPEPEPEPDPGPERERAEEIRRALVALFALEEVRGLDLLEAGLVADEGWIGPVVFRLIDETGMLTGSLFAERMRFEASRSARSLTLVLEEGHESRAGIREPFDGGVRRIQLPYVDPDPFLDAAPELFTASDLIPELDDGAWDREALRRRLNRLLGLDASDGWYRLRSLAGVQGETLLDVHVEVFDADGRISRRLFADRMELRAEPPGVALVLEDGAVVRGDDKQAFLGGTYRVFLPRAALDEWRAARLPGLSAPPSTVETPSEPPPR